MSRQPIFTPALAARINGLPDAAADVKFLAYVGVIFDEYVADAITSDDPVKAYDDLIKAGLTRTAALLFGDGVRTLHAARFPAPSK